jgi:hypothetical protein
MEKTLKKKMKRILKMIRMRILKTKTLMMKKMMKRKRTVK